MEDEEEEVEDEEDEEEKEEGRKEIEIQPAKIEQDGRRGKKRGTGECKRNGNVKGEVRHTFH